MSNPFGAEAISAFVASNETPAIAEAEPGMVARFRRFWQR